MSTPDWTKIAGLPDAMPRMKRGERIEMLLTHCDDKPESGWNLAWRDIYNAFWWRQPDKP